MPHVLMSKGAPTGRRWLGIDGLVHDTHVFERDDLISAKYVRYSVCYKFSLAEDPAFVVTGPDLQSVDIADCGRDVTCFGCLSE